MPLPPGGLSDNIFSWSYLEDSGSSRLGPESPTALGLTDGQTFQVGQEPATVRFYSPAGADAELVIYDVSGRRTQNLNLLGTGTAGWVDLVWDGRSRAGKPVSSGIYFGKLEAQNETVHLRFVVVR